jgi:hypothetical protein
VVLVVLALSAVGAASASAAEWYAAGKALSGSSKLLESVRVEEAIVLSVPRLEMSMTCSGVKAGSAEIIAKSSAKARFVLTGCKMTEAVSGCEIGSEITTEALEGSPTLGTYPEDKIELKPQSGTTFGAVPFDSINSCAFKSAVALKGKLTLSLPRGQEDWMEQIFAGQGTKESPGHLEMLGDPVYVTGKLKLSQTTLRSWSFH